jgi:ABC-type polysaccharide/polyol phosphate export permease
MSSYPTRPPSDSISADTGWFGHFRELFAYKYLLYNLIVRDLKVRYKNSALGVLWSLLNPLLIMLVFTLVFNVLANQDIPNYSVFILVGILPWNFFSGSVVGGSNAILSNGSLVKKVYFPRVMLPGATIFSNLVHFLLALLILVFFLYVTGLGLTVHSLWVPALVVTQIIFMLGLVLFLSSVHVFYRDVAMILEVVMLAWFFLTPVFYSLEIFADSPPIMGVPPDVLMRWINPMASIIDGYRTVLWGVGNGGVAMDPSYLARTFVTAVLTFIIGYLFFRRTEHLFGEKL